MKKETNKAKNKYRSTRRVRDGEIYQQKKKMFKIQIKKAKKEKL